MRNTKPGISRAHLTYSGCGITARTLLEEEPFSPALGKENLLARRWTF